MQFLAGQHCPEAPTGHLDASRFTIRKSRGFSEKNGFNCSLGPTRGSGLERRDQSKQIGRNPTTDPGRDPSNRAWTLLPGTSGLLIKCTP